MRAIGIKKLKLKDERSRRVNDAVLADVMREGSLPTRSGSTRSCRVTHSDPARMLLGRIAMVELTRPVLARALEPFPGVTRTLDALHLASMCFVRNSDPSLAVATYDERLARAASGLKFKILRP